MPQDTQLDFADRIGHFYARRFGFPSMAGRLSGYLLVCDSQQQSIDELSDAPLASRSAIAGAVKLLESFGMVRRTRMAGERVDRVRLCPVNDQPQHFDSAVHKEHAALFREGPALLGNASPERLVPLQEKIAPAGFPAERLPGLLDEWRVRRNKFAGKPVRRHQSNRRWTRCDPTRRSARRLEPVS